MDRRSLTKQKPLRYFHPSFDTSRRQLYSCQALFQRFLTFGKAGAVRSRKVRNRLSGAPFGVDEEPTADESQLLGFPGRLQHAVSAKVRDGRGNDHVEFVMSNINTQRNDNFVAVARTVLWNVGLSPLKGGHSPAV